ncbi:MAG: 30S ribosomal protein S12 methylthiotransferase RimO [Planctomycetota bacterium]|jgi:ribosomal protein S12 methylthiotransferase
MVNQPIKIAFIALGCAKNLVDSEKMLGLLGEAGAIITPDEADADVIVINTCGFLQAARAEAHHYIAQAIEQKQTGHCRRVVVAGCLPQRDGEKLLKDLPGIDALIGIHQRDKLVQAALKPLPKTKRRPQPDLYLSDSQQHLAPDTARLRLTPRHYAYLRISDGCDHMCTFCTIPTIKGPMRSKPLQIVLEEARELIGDGALELNLIGQDTSAYGQDIGYTEGIAGLLGELNQLQEIKWIRLLYAYPSTITDQIIDQIAQCQRVVKYIDIPLQHINDRILKAMHRTVTRRQTEALIQKLRDRIPNINIRTTLIAGFPGETESEFEELLQFVRQTEFSALGVFPFSYEPETPSARLSGQLPDELKHARADAIMEIQQQIAFQQAAQQVGKTFQVLIDEQTDDQLFVGRHAGQAPDVDAVTYVSAANLQIGQCLQVRCQASQEYDLIAQPTDDIRTSNKTSPLTKGG